MRNKQDNIRTKTIKRKRLIAVVVFLIVILIISILITIHLRVREPLATTDTAETKTTSEEPTSASDITQNIVCLDPGHGGKDVGASFSDLCESDINLKVALQVKSILEQENYNVYITRSDDTFVAKRNRAYYCNSKNADILVSIHHNSYPSDHTVNYGTALYYKDRDQLLASSLLTSTSDQLDIKNQGISKFDNSLLWVANMPSALIEASFLSNNNEYNLLSKSNSARITDEARGIATGIVNYFTKPEQIDILISDDPLVIDVDDLVE